MTSTLDHMDTSTVDPQLVSLFAQVDDCLKTVAVLKQNIQRISIQVRDLCRQFEEDPSRLNPSLVSPLRYSIGGVIESFTKQLFVLDSIPSLGDASLKQRRKEVVQEVQRSINEAEQLLKLTEELLADVKHSPPTSPIPIEPNATPNSDCLVADKNKVVPMETDTPDEITQTTPAEPPQSQPQPKEEETEEETEEQPELQPESQNSQHQKQPRPSHVDPAQPQVQTSQKQQKPSNTAPSTQRTSAVRKLNPKATIDDYGHQWIARIPLPPFDLDNISFNVHREQGAQLLEVIGMQPTRSEPISFNVTFRLPLSANLDAATAKMMNGTLQVVIPRKRSRGQRQPGFGRTSNWFGSPMPSFFSDPQFVW
eukprot:c9190_g1_i1.p1 GENE.c9190_g1_i1~~c9190_g1_i1.p1  ORF type:complete len:375 (+),score=100.36 c9190_g1_i1:26-1126(+)